MQHLLRECGSGNRRQLMAFGERSTLVGWHRHARGIGNNRSWIGARHLWLHSGALEDSDGLIVGRVGSEADDDQPLIALRYSDRRAMRRAGWRAACCAAVWLARGKYEYEAGKGQQKAEMLVHRMSPLYQRAREDPSPSGERDESALPLCLTTFRILCCNTSMKQSTGFRLTPEARALLDAMSKASGISHTAMLEILIREGAKKRGVRADSGVQSQG